MRLRSIISLLLCVSLIFLSFGFVSLADTNPDTNNDSETNVITESDSGGGDISTRELFALLIVMIAAIVIIAIVL